MRNEKDNEEGKEGDIDEIKHDLQMVRFEMHNHIRKAKTTTVKSLLYLHNGVSIVGTPVLANSENSLLVEKFQDFKSYEKDFKDIVED